MFKKLSAFGLSFLLIFSPTFVLAKEQADSKNEPSLELEKNDGVPATEGTTTDESTQIRTTKEEQVNESLAEDVDNETAQKEEQNDNEANPLNEEEGNESAEYKGASTNNATEEMESNQDKDELNLQLVGGTAKVSNKDIVYNYNKGYYEVRVQAGLFNPTSQEIKDKWVAFALPEGVYLANENVPSGVEFVKVNGHNGIAVKIPNVGPYGHKSIFPIIPLKIDPNVAEGKVEDRNPYYTLHLYEYDPASDSFYDLGELGNQREIDFTQFEATPVLDITSRINGNATFDKEKHHYVLDVTIETTNHSAIKTDNVYLGIPLPDTVGVLKTSEHDGTYFALDSGEVAVKLPAIEVGKTNTVTYQIPIIGVADSNVQATTMNAFLIRGLNYEPVGTINGSITLDLSEMNKEWLFEAESQIVRNLPGLFTNEFGLYFGFNVQNLTINDVDQVIIEFLVPDQITVYEPDSYEKGEIPASLKEFLKDNAPTTENLGNLDIQWQGNKAVVKLDKLEATEYNQGYFSAYAESDIALEDLAGLEVKVTLLVNGQEKVITIVTPFKIVDDQDKETKDPEKTGEGQKNGKTDKPGEPKQPENPEIQSDTGKSGDITNQQEISLEDEKTADQNISIVGNHKNNSTKETGSSKTLEAAELPITATNSYTLLLIGSILTTIAIFTMFFLRKRAKTN